MGAMQISDRIGRRLKLHDLHVLMAVGQLGRMGRAAQLLNTTQPAISRSIADLEHAIGVRLLDRRRHGVELTEHGRAMRDGGLAMFDELRQAVKNIEFLSDPTAGEVRIGTTPPLAASFVSAIIDRLSQRHPRIVFHVTTDRGEAQLRNLRERNVDLLIFRRTSDFTGEQVTFEKLYESPYVVAAGTNSPWVRRRRIELAELMGESWALPPQSGGVGAFFAPAFRAGGFELPHATVVAFAHELGINLARTGRYLTVLPEFLLQFPSQHPFIKKLPVELPIASEPIGIITRNNRAPSPVVQRFIDCAREVAKPLAKQRR